MEYSDIRFECEDGIAVITLHRPASMNVFSAAMGDELGHVYRLCDQDDDVRVVVLTGSGDAFCAGADMSAGAQTFGSQDVDAFSASPVSPPAWEVRKPVIAAMNGHAIGLGLSLALQCDLRIAANEGKYGLLQVRRGIMPDACSHWTLSRIVGSQQAARLLLTGCKIDGAEAARIGLALESRPRAEVLDAALELARDLRDNTAPLSVAVSKKLLWDSWNFTREEVEVCETRLHHHLMGSDDAVEGPAAWLERRAPRFTLRVSRDWPEWPDPSGSDRS